MDTVIESKYFIYILYKSYELYFKYGSRSSKKVIYFHNKIKEILQTIFNKSIYVVEIEYNIKSYNSMGKKQCDIVILKYNKPYVVFPIKIIMSNFKQNKNNSWENLTGELIHLKWMNENINIIPINIFINLTPYLDKNKHITKFENIEITDINNYNILKTKNICYDIINYIIDVEHECCLKQIYNKSPLLLRFNLKTPYRKFNDVLQDLNI
jgi:hypothetical protein